MAKLIDRGKLVVSFNSEDLSRKRSSLLSIAQNPSGIFLHLYDLWNSLKNHLHERISEDLEKRLWSNYINQLRPISLTSNIQPIEDLEANILYSIGIKQGANAASGVVDGQGDKSAGESRSRNAIFQQSMSESLRYFNHSANEQDRRLTLVKIEFIFISLLKKESIANLLDVLAMISTDAFGVSISSEKVYSIIVNYRNWVAQNLNSDIIFRSIDLIDRELESFLFQLLIQYETQVNRTFGLFQSISEKQAKLFMLMTSLNNLAIDRNLLLKLGILSESKKEA